MLVRQGQVVGRHVGLLAHVFDQHSVGIARCFERHHATHRPHEARGQQGEIAEVAAHVDERIARFEMAHQ